MNSVEGVTWMKRKYRTHKPTQDGYKPPAGSDSTKKRPNYKKASDKEKRVISASQPKKVMVYDVLKGRGRMMTFEELTGKNVS